MMSTIKRLLEENGYICTNKAKYADEYVKDDRVVYALPINSLNIVVAPDTTIGATWEEDAKEYHATSLRKFPKKMNKGATEINYGIQVRFNAENQMVKFLKELDCDMVEDNNMSDAFLNDNSNVITNDMKAFNSYLEFGNWVRETRLAKGITQKKFAEIIDCTIEHLSKVENGHRIPSRLLIETIVNAFDCELVLLGYREAFSLRLSLI